MDADTDQLTEQLSQCDVSTADRSTELLPSPPTSPSKSLPPRGMPCNGMNNDNCKVISNFTYDDSQVISNFTSDDSNVISNLNREVTQTTSANEKSDDKLMADQNSNNPNVIPNATAKKLIADTNFKTTGLPPSRTNVTALNIAHYTIAVSHITVANDIIVLTSIDHTDSRTFAMNTDTAEKHTDDKPVFDNRPKRSQDEECQHKLRIDDLHEHLSPNIERYISEHGFSPFEQLQEIVANTRKLVRNGYGIDKETGVVNLLRRTNNGH